MRTLVLVVSMLFLQALSLPARAIAPSGQLICALVDVYDCSQGDCSEVESEVVGVPDLVRVDRDKQTMTALDGEFGHATTKLEAQSSEGGKTTARAHEGERSLVLSVEDASGYVTLTITDPKVTVVAYGECAKP